MVTMVTIKKLVPAIAIALALPLGSACAQYNQGGYQPQGGYEQGGQQGGWDAPPPDYSDELRQRAFHDGIEGARADFNNQAQPRPEQHEEFRHPKVPFLARATYRDAYKRGYFTAMKHMEEHREGDRDRDHDRDRDQQNRDHQDRDQQDRDQQDRDQRDRDQQGGYQQQGGWDAPPSEYSDDVQRHAFRDGIEAARADVANNVQPNPEQHEEFRHPRVDYGARDSYREAYKRGYFMAVRHLQEQGR